MLCLLGSICRPYFPQEPCLLNTFSTLSFLVISDHQSRTNLLPLLLRQFPQLSLQTLNLRYTKPSALISKPPNPKSTKGRLPTISPPFNLLLLQLDPSPISHLICKCCHQ